MINEFDGDLYRIRTQIGTVEATEEHPFFVRRRLNHRSHPIRLGNPEWVKASEINVGDFLCVPRFKATNLRNDRFIDLEPFIRQGTDSLGRRTFGNRVINRQLPLTVDLAWLIGLYVAEGSFVAANGDNGFQLSLGTHEGDLIERVKAITTNFGYSPCLTVDGSSTSVLIHSTVLARWLDANCGHGAHHKHVPDVVLRHADPAIRRAFLDGYTRGDGYKAARKPWHVMGTVSRALSHDIPLLLAQDGLGAAVGMLYKGPRQIGKSWTNKKLELFQIGYHIGGGAVSRRVMNGHEVSTTHARFKVDSDGVWYPVKDIKASAYKGLVYNMETADHTYVAGGYLVHNCDRAINFALVTAFSGSNNNNKYQPPPGVLLPLDKKHESYTAEEHYEVEQEQKDDSGNGYGPNDQPSPGEGCGVVPSRGENGNEPGQGRPEDKSCFPSVGEAAREWRQIAAQAIQQAREAGDRRGDILVRVLEVPPSRVKWNQIIRGVFSRAIAEHGRDDVAWTRRSRRSFDSDFILPGGVTFRARAAVCVDTSGSVPDQSIQQAVSEVKALVEAMRVAVYLVVHDADVQWEGWLKPGVRTNVIAEKMTGRGGTRYKPAYDAVEKAAKRFDGMVHLTDGEPCDKWPRKPSNVRRLVVALLGCKSQHSIPEDAIVIEAEI